MRKSQIVLMCAVCLFVVTSAVTAQKAKSAMTNADVIQMVSAALSEQVIITSIRQAASRDFDLTPTGLIALKKAGVSDKVIQVMQEVSTSAKSGSAATGKVPADDREQTVHAVLRQAVMAQSRGALSLSSFQKTNGYEQEVTKMYVLEWQAEILFQQEGHKMGNGFVGYWQDFRILQQQPGTLESIGMSPRHFNKGARIRLTGDSTFRKTEQGWRLERLKPGTAQVVAESGPTDSPPPVAGSTAGASSDGSPVAAPTANRSERDRLYGKNVEMSPGNLSDLGNEIEGGKEVTIPVRLNSGVGINNMVNATVTLTKTSFAFTASCCFSSFTVTPDKILELTNQLQPNQVEQVSRLHVKVAIKNKKGDKEDKKDFYFYNSAAQVKEGTNGYGPIVCSRCDDSMNVLYALLQKVRGMR